MQVISLYIKCNILQYNLCLQQHQNAHLQELCLSKEKHTFICTPEEGITRYNIINNFVPHIQSWTMATCTTKKGWSKDSLVKALEDLQEKISPRK